MPDANALFYQPACGLSGDMHLGALLDLGAPEAYLRAELAKLPLAGEFDLEIRPGEKMGITGTYVNVHAEEHHHHRHFSTIADMITRSGFEAAVETRAIEIFRALAEAEGKIHGMPAEDVHFHEVGAVDSIVDIVGAAIVIESFSPTYLLCNTVEVGSGFVDCAHGRFPVPAPATQELLKEVPCHYGGVSGESTTPTGAAILAANVHEYAPQHAFAPTKIGYGIGHKDFELPNVLRVVLGTYSQPDASAVAAGPVDIETQYLIEANFDDLTGEAFEPLTEGLFAAGALDVYLTPIQMKKNRPGQCLTALCTGATKDSVCAALFNSSTTIGLRISPVEKRMLKRELQTVSTSLGEVQIKRVTQPDGRSRWKSEYADIAALAETHNLPFSEAKAAVDAEIRAKLG